MNLMMRFAAKTWLTFVCFCWGIKESFKEKKMLRNDSKNASEVSATAVCHSLLSSPLHLQQHQQRFGALGFSVRGNGESGCHCIQWWHNSCPKSHLIYSTVGVCTYLESDFSYTCTAVAAWGWDGEWVLITGGEGDAEGRHRGTEEELQILRPDCLPRK